MTEQYIAPVGTQKQTDSFWYRKNSTSTQGAIANTSNPALGIEDIVIIGGNQDQLAKKILANGRLVTAVGSISFSICLSKNNAPFVKTASTENGVNEDGSKKWFEHINLKAPVKAQILRLFEALQSGQPLQQAPVQPMMNTFNPYAQMMPYGAVPNPYQPAPAPQQANYTGFTQPTPAPAIDYTRYNNAELPTGPVNEDDLPY